VEYQGKIIFPASSLKNKVTKKEFEASDKLKVTIETR
jgi:hypothetical protein